MKTAIELVIEERIRQMEKEGFLYAHDDTHTDNELPYAAAAYILPDPLRSYFQSNLVHRSDFFPWGKEWWKPTPEDRIRELVKGVALAVAEIERLQRLQLTTDTSELKNQ